MIPEELAKNSPGGSEGDWYWRHGGWIQTPDNASTLKNTRFDPGRHEQAKFFALGEYLGR
ncbi:MAG: hypothetical protein ACI90G_001264 [Urechidicola sp.]|jgi:hypothetical protein